MVGQERDVVASLVGPRDHGDSTTELLPKAGVICYNRLYYNILY